MFIQATKLHKAFDENIVLNDISFTVGPKARIGLVGENGAGKSTLLKIIQGQITEYEGSLVIKKGVSIVYVPQVPNVNDCETVNHFLEPYAERPYMVNEVLESLDVSQIQHKRFSELSGGQKTKVYLARIALHKADVLLLDEPTNHLDLQGLHWLESYLKKFNGALIIISHDRFFLDRVVNEVLEIEKGELNSFGGNYTFYREQKQVQKEAYANQYLSQQKEVRRLKRAVKRQKDEGNRKNADRKNDRDNDKYGVSFFADRASKKLHSSGKNTEARLEHMDILEKPDKETVLDLYFNPSGAQNSNVVSIEDMSIGYEEPLFHIDSLSILYGNRIALQGENGSGKTTLIKRILNHAAYEEVVVGPGVQIGYLSQDHSVICTPKLRNKLQRFKRQSVVCNLLRTPQGVYTPMRNEVFWYCSA